jgi:hypothetical protein
VGGVDSTEFESILVSKGLPHTEFSHKGVIDAHRSITSHNDVPHLNFRRHPFFEGEVRTLVSIPAKASAAKRLRSTGF